MYTTYALHTILSRQWESVDFRCILLSVIFVSCDGGKGAPVQYIAERTISI